jgi:two-component system NtrC family response regulator
MKKKLLIIEDEVSLAKQLKWALGGNYEITVANDGKRARPLIASKEFPLITLDLGLPPFPDTPQEGFKLLEEIRDLSPNSKVIVITGNSEEENAIKAIGLGAIDFCPKPVEPKLLDLILSRTFRIYELEAANRNLQQKLTNKGSLCGMLGISEAMTSLFERIQQASITDYTVLITGETGTGKEMAAKAIHCLSHRAQMPLVTINCGAIPEHLIESELFGHERGAFTGAVSRRFGRFEQANGGTVFLDEIGDMPFPLQVKILRFLQEGTIERVGGNTSITLDIRVITATNIDLEEALQKGTFREDLYHRLNVIPLSMPSLRERPEDVLLLSRHFLREELNGVKRDKLSFSPGALASMAGHHWPGNVRELQNRIRRAIAVAVDAIQPEDLGLEGVEKSPERAPIIVETLQEVRNRAESAVIRKTLALSGGNISQAARLLNVSRPTLHDLMKRHGIC